MAFRKEPLSIEYETKPQRTHEAHEGTEGEREHMGRRLVGTGRKERGSNGRCCTWTGRAKTRRSKENCAEESANNHGGYKEIKSGTCLYNLPQCDAAPSISDRTHKWHSEP